MTCCLYVIDQRMPEEGTPVPPNCTACLASLATAHANTLHVDFVNGV